MPKPKRKKEHQGHGWVEEHPSGERSDCGGPLRQCQTCLVELARHPLAWQEQWCAARGITLAALDTPEDYPLGKHSE